MRTSSIIEPEIPKAWALMQALEPEDLVRLGVSNVEPQADIRLGLPDSKEPAYQRPEHITRQIETSYRESLLPLRSTISCRGSNRNAS